MLTIVVCQSLESGSCKCDFIFNNRTLDIRRISSYPSFAGMTLQGRGTAAVHHLPDMSEGLVVRIQDAEVKPDSEGLRQWSMGLI